MAAVEVRDAAHLAALPDGSIITWLRIPGDETSEAIAFVHVEMEQCTDLDGRPLAFGNEAPGELPGMMRVVWISPGGWQPMTIEDAGVNYPVHVLRWGEGTDDDYQAKVDQIQSRWAWPEPPPLLPMLDGLHGGTWAREKALECASRFWAGQAVGATGWVDHEQICTTAERFETWLDRKAAVDQSSEAQLETVDVGEAWVLADAISAADPDLDRPYSLAKHLISKGWRR